jgi:hypothetical protein
MTIVRTISIRLNSAGLRNAFEADGTRIPLNRNGYARTGALLDALSRYYVVKATDTLDTFTLHGQAHPDRVISQRDEAFVSRMITHDIAAEAAAHRTNLAIAAIESGLVASGAIDAPATCHAVPFIIAGPNGSPVLNPRHPQHAARLKAEAEAAAMVPQQVQQQQGRDARHASGILSPGCIPEPRTRARKAAAPAIQTSTIRNVVMAWADDAVTYPAFSERTNRGECHRDEACGVRLIQTGKDRFTVVYGKQVKADLNYAQAAAEYGRSVMHALACEGMLDNRERGER